MEKVWQIQSNLPKGVELINAGMDTSLALNSVTLGTNKKIDAELSNTIVAMLKDHLDNFQLQWNFQNNQIRVQLR